MIPFHYVLTYMVKVCTFSHRRLGCNLLHHPFVEMSVRDYPIREEKLFLPQLPPLREFFSYIGYIVFKFIHMDSIRFK